MSILLLQLQNVNSAVLLLYEADSKDTLLKKLNGALNYINLKIEKKLILAIVRNDSFSRCEDEIKTFKNNKRFVDIQVFLNDDNEAGYNVIAVTTDITEKKIAAHKLKESEKKYRDMIEYSPIGIFCYQHSKIIFGNTAAVKILGYKTKDEFKLLQAADFVHPAYKQISKKRVKALLSGKVKQNKIVHQKFIRKDGGVIDVQVVSHLIDLPTGPAVQVSIIDITKQKIAEQNININEKRLISMVENLPIAIIRHRQGKVVYANKTAFEIMGFTSLDEVGNRTIFDFVHPDSLEMAIERVKKLFNGKMMISPLSNQKYIRKDGTFIDVIVVSQVVDDLGGPLIQASFFDVTQVRKLEDELRESDEKFRAFFEQSSDGLSMVDLDGNIVEWNSKNAEITGIPAKQAINKNIENIHPLLLPHEKLESLISKNNGETIEQKIKKMKLPLTASHEILVHKQKVKHIKSTLFPIKTKRSSKIGQIVRDESEIFETKQKLETSLKEKEILLREVHHRTKNNMNIITSLMSMQLHEKHSIELDEAFANISNRIRTMAIVHEELYQSDNLSEINLCGYLDKLLNHLRNSLHGFSNNIDVHVKCQAIALSMEKAIPLGLVLN